MDNYYRALLYARELFLNWDQERIIARASLRSDAQYIYLSFLGEPWRIERESGIVESICTEAREADFSEALSIYDYLCREEPLAPLSGRYCPANSLPHLAQSNPSPGDFHQRHADFLQEHIPALRQALCRIGLAPFSKGDAACVFPVFDGFNAIFQFWEGDEDFPPSVRFLWDENTRDRLKYETLYYIMGVFLQNLRSCIAEIEKNS